MTDPSTAIGLALIVIALAVLAASGRPARSRMADAVRRREE